MKESYNPTTDEMTLQIKPVKGKPTKRLGSFKFWWGKDGTYRAISIGSYKANMKEFKKHLKTIPLGGIWKGIKITDDDIKGARKDLLDTLEEKL